MVLQNEGWEQGIKIGTCEDLIIYKIFFVIAGVGKNATVNAINYSPLF